MKIGNQKKDCCSTCPYARTTLKEYLDTRGDNGEAFIGQAVTSSLLPCHMMDAEGQGMAHVHTGQDQCAGAAKFRANLGVAPHLSDALGKLEGDTVNVFATPAELLAHHKGWELEYAETYIDNIKSVSRMGYEQQIIALFEGRVGLIPNAQ